MSRERKLEIIKAQEKLVAEEVALEKANQASEKLEDANIGNIHHPD